MSKLRDYIRDHQVEILGGITATAIVSGYLLTVNLASKEAAKTARRIILNHPVRIDVNAQDVVADLMPHIYEEFRNNVKVELSPGNYELIAQRVLEGMKAVKKADKLAKAAVQAASDA